MKKIIYSLLLLFIFITTGCKYDENFLSGLVEPDREAPVVSISSPVHQGAFKKENIIIKGTASDDVGIYKVSVALNGNDYSSAAGTESWSIGINAGELVYGENTITAKAEDYSGNISIPVEISIIIVPNPGIDYTLPSNGDTGISVNRDISIVFTTDMDGSSINDRTIVVKDSLGNTINGDVSYVSEEKKAVFEKNGEWFYDDNYTVTLTTGAEDSAGNSFNDDYSFSFFTREYGGVVVSRKNMSLMEGETASFTIKLTSAPLHDVAVDLATGMPYELIVEPEQLTFNADNYSDEVEVEVTAADNEIAEGVASVYTLNIGDLESEDAAYDGLSVPPVNVIVNDNDEKPYAVYNIPYKGQTRVPITQQVSVEFSKDMDPGTINANTFIVEDSNNNKLDGRIFYYPHKRMAVFQNRGHLDFNHEYTVTVKALVEYGEGVKDRAGNNLLSDFSFVFRTEFMVPRLVGSQSTPDSGLGVAVSGNYAYMAINGVGLKVLDISDPAGPMSIANCYLSGSANDVAVSGNYAYLAGGFVGLLVIDISDPYAPVMVGRCGTPGFASGLFISGNYAYLADGSDGFRVIDISDPSNPAILGSCDTVYSASKVFVSGNYAYVGGYLKGLQVIDISDPAAPTVVAYSATPNDVRGICVSGNYAYVAGRGDGLYVFDISNPLSLSIVGHCDTPDSTSELDISGKYAYLTHADGVRVIDISEPSAPNIAGNYNNTGSSYAVFVRDRYAYVTDNKSLKIIDIDYWSTPVIVGDYDTPGYSYGICVADNYAYVADKHQGLQVIDISNPSSPSVTGDYDTPGNAKGVDVSGDYAYVADDYSGLQVFDVSDPSAVTIVGNCDTPGKATEVVVLGSYAYVADWNGGLQVLDILNPSSPSIVGSCATSGDAYGVYISGDYAYVAGGCGGLEIIDISDPESPTIVGNCDINLAEGVHVSGNYAYVADGTTYAGTVYKGLQVVDISNPESPVIVAFCYTPMAAYGLYVSGNYAYVANGIEGLMVIDISDPLFPTKVGNTDTPGFALEVAVTGNYAYVADLKKGLQVIHLGPYQ
ncbi:MAG: hypothetical protein GY754_14300 [bacterium]|nr:hypothetical protein [bacterium]